MYKEFRLLIEQNRWEKEGLDSMQKALIENEEKYHQLADNLPQFVCETDQFGNLTYVNSNWPKSFVYGSEDVEKGINILIVKNGMIKDQGLILFLY